MAAERTYIMLKPDCIRRGLMGATKFEDMAAGTIRGDFAFNTGENIIHGSDSRESAETEIKRFFG